MKKLTHQFAAVALVGLLVALSATAAESLSILFQQGIPAVSVNDPLDDLASAHRRDFFAAVAQLFPVHPYDRITFAERFPIKTVGSIQDDSGGGRRTQRALGGTEQDFDKRLIGDAQGV